MSSARARGIRACGCKNGSTQMAGLRNAWRGLEGGVGGKKPGPGGHTGEGGVGGIRNRDRAATPARV
eukprot:13271-Chlamydomonas_euryale.AAC.5